MAAFTGGDGIMGACIVPFLTPAQGSEGFFADMFENHHTSGPGTAALPQNMLADTIDFGFVYGFLATARDLRRKGENFAGGKLTKGWAARLDLYAKGGLRTAGGAGVLCGCYLAVCEATRKYSSGGEGGGATGGMLTYPLFAGIFLTMIKTDLLAVVLRVAPFAAPPVFLGCVGQDVIFMIKESWWALTQGWNDDDP